jgi:5-methylcytosine-specific restriction endonuclease McrA
VLTDHHSSGSLQIMPKTLKVDFGTAVAREAFAIIKAHPDGLDITEIRSLLGDLGSQEQLSRRIRHLRKQFDITCTKKGDRYVYQYRGEKPQRATDSGVISGKQRARILNFAHGRCQMCGRTVNGDGIKLQIDHKVPQNWGGLTVDENLWAICVQCNHGKRDHFASYDAQEMANVISYESVHERIAHFLKMHIGKAVESHLIEFVANATEVQDDWKKRLRDLRYPVIGLDITSGRFRTSEGFIRSTYTLHNWRDLPSNHRQLIRDWENAAKRAKLKKLLGIS